MQGFDIVVVGAGTAGIPATIEAARTGARVLLIEKSDRVGGTLHVSRGQMSGSGTQLQRERGISDSVDAHVADAVRISRGTCNVPLVTKAASLAGGTIDWLMSHGFEMDPSCPAILHLHEAYRVPRTYWGINAGLSVLAVLQPLLDETLTRPNVELRLKTELVSLRSSSSGRISGIVARDRQSGVAEEIEAGSVVLATGGYAGNREMFARLTKDAPLFTSALPIATGKGIEIAEAAGAAVQGAEHFIPTFAGIEEEPGSGRVVWDHLPSLTPQIRQPWEIYVGADGNRFVREDIDSVDARERALMRLPDLTFWTIFDDAILKAAPPLLPGWSANDLEAAWRRHPSFAVADTIEGLAQRAGIEKDGLSATVENYNRSRSDGNDAWGRVHVPLPIAKPPFRAIRMHGIVLKTPAGLAVDESLRVLDRAGVPIGGLYAIGEATGGATLSGNSFVGGMSVTPALSFGRWLGQQLGRHYARAAA
jgi:fumarate reductase flavoprotein subunit